MQALRVKAGDTSGKIFQHSWKISPVETSESLYAGFLECLVRFAMV